MRHEISNIKTLYSLKESFSTYETIFIDAEQLLERRLLSHAVFYARNRIRKNGKILLKGPSRSKNKFGLRGWQSLAKCQLGQSGVRFTSNEKQIEISGRTRTTRAQSVGLYVITSGSNSTRMMLSKCIKNIQKARKACPIDTTVALVGPEADIRRNNNIPNNVSTIDFPSSASNRILIGPKKNYALRNSNCDIVIILHERIQIAPDFLENIKQYPISFSAPRVLAAGDAYLDIIFSKNPLVNGPYIARNKTSRFFNQFNYLKGFKKWHPYIDGGIVIINKSELMKSAKDIEIWHDSVAFKECEDVVASNRAYARGCIIDYQPNLICESAINRMEKRSRVKKIMQEYAWKILT